MCCSLCNKTNNVGWCFISLLTLFVSTLFGFISYPEDKPDISFYNSDSVRIDLVELLGHDSLLEGYKAMVYTPICEEDQCYAVEIVFYWDALGNFDKFEFMPEKPLTKRGHEPFTPADYAALQNILRKKESCFSGLAKEQLVEKVKTDYIDGYTGATVATIKNETIQAAVYSCYTLWHIAHGEVVDTIRSNFKYHLTEQMVSRIVSSRDMESYYLLIDQLGTGEFGRYWTELIRMLHFSEGYFAKNLFEKLPSEVLNHKVFQDALAPLYSGFDYFARLSLLKRNDLHVKSVALSNEIIQEADTVNFLLTDRIFQLAGQNKFLLNREQRKKLSFYKEKLNTR